MDGVSFEGFFFKVYCFQVFLERFGRWYYITYNMSLSSKKLYFLSYNFQHSDISVENVWSYSISNEHLNEKSQVFPSQR